MADDQPKHPASARLAGQTLPNPVLIRRLLGLAWQYRAGCLLVLSQQLLLVGFTLGGIGLTGLGIDFLRHRLDPSAPAPHWPLGLEPAWSTRTTLAAIAVSIAVVALLHSILRFQSIVSASRLVEAIVVRLRSEVYDKLQRLSFRFYDANETGSIINRVAGDVQAARMFVDGVVIQVLGVLLSLVVYITYMCRIHVPLTLACLATTPLLWWGAVLFSRTVRPAYHKNSQLVDRMILALSESVQGMQVIKGFARERDRAAHFQDRTTAVRDQKERIFFHISMFQPSITLLTQVNMVILLGYGGFLVSRGELPLGEGLFVFANVLQQFATQVGQITNIANSIQASLTGSQRVFEVLDAPVEIQSPANPARLGRAQGAIRFENVSFAYRDQQWVLRDIDFTMEPGQRVAIVGATGAGKSTLLSLVPRFYDPNPGRVLVDGIDVRALDVDDLRRNIGLVFQESFLFSNTVAANIAFGHPDATRERIEAAARIAGAAEFIEHLPKGYETVIGEHGSNLSGGQRQRIALARALLLDPPILLLDDPTAAIDPETEHEILAAMESALRGRTTLVVAHRISTLRRADLILVLDEGRVLERGTHEELLKRKGHYRHVARLQLAGVEQRRRLLQAEEIA